MNQKGIMLNQNSEYRPGSQGGSVKLVLAVFMALAFSVFLVGTAMAEVTMNGYVSGQFGTYDAEKKKGAATTSTTTTAAGIRMDSNAQIDFHGKGEKGAARLRLRVREDSGGSLATWRHHVYWYPTEQLSIGWMGGGFGLAAANVNDGNAAVGTLSDGSPIGGMTQLDGFYTVSGLDVNFKLSSDMQAGVYILDECHPSCTFDDGTKTAGTTVKDVGGTPTVVATSTDNAPQGANQTNAMTLVPYFMGTFGPITVGAYVTSASADDMSQTTATGDSDPQPVEASSTSVQAKFATGDMSVSLEISQAAVSPNSTLLTKRGASSTISDAETSLTSIGFRIAGLQSHYTTSVWTVSDGPMELESTTTEIAAGYKIPMGLVTLVPEFAQRTSENTDSTQPTAVDESTATIIALGAIASF